METIEKKQDIAHEVINLISKTNVPIVKASDGSRLILSSLSTFKTVDHDFVDWGLYLPGIATAETPMLVWEVINSCMFIDVFSALPGSWDQKWVSQNQVVDFCEEFPDWLRDKCATFFLIKKDENKPIEENNFQSNLAVVGVRVLPGGLSVYADSLLSEADLHKRSYNRVISPRLSHLAI